MMPQNAVSRLHMFFGHAIALGSSKVCLPLFALLLSLKGIPLLAQVSCKSAALLALAPGRQVFAQVKAVSIL